MADLQGRRIIDRYLGAGGQFGGVAATLGEPTPVECIAEDLSTLLKIDYGRCLELTKKHDGFRINFARTMAESVKRTILNDRVPTRARTVALVHQSDQTRVVSRMLFQRLTEYG